MRTERQRDRYIDGHKDKDINFRQIYMKIDGQKL